MDDNIVNFKLAKLLRTPAPWETKAQNNAKRLSVRQAVNEAILDLVRGVPAMAEDEAANDPRNPNTP